MGVHQPLYRPPGVHDAALRVRRRPHRVTGRLTARVLLLGASAQREMLFTAQRKMLFTAVETAVQDSIVVLVSILSIITGVSFCRAGLCTHLICHACIYVCRLLTTPGLPA